MNFFERLFRGVVGRLPHAGKGWSYFLTGRSKLDWEASVGDGSGNSAVQACLRVICASFTEAPPLVQRRTAKGWEEVPGHAAVELLETPNPFMTGELLWRSVLTSLHLDGNAYLLKLRSGAGTVAQLWPIFPHHLEPWWDEGNPTAYIDAYEYTGHHGATLYIDPRDIIHFRLNIDPANTRKGLSPIKALARDIYTDNEAGDFTATLLTNLGVPSVLISPDGEVPIGPDEAEYVRETYMRRVGNDGRGGPLILSGKTKVEVLSFNPEQMQMADLRRLPETRISAVFGPAAIVAGLDAGLQRSTFANFAEAREATFEVCIIPLFRLIGGDLKRQLLPEFGLSKGHRLTFDTSEIRILQEDEDRRHARVREDWNSGLLKLGEARTELGLEATGPEMDLYAVPSGVTLTKPAELGKPPEPPALPPGTPPGDDPTKPGKPKPPPKPADVKALFGAGEDARHSGLMVGLWLDATTAQALALDGGESPEQLHVTLCYCGDASLLGDLTIAQALIAVNGVVADQQRLTGKVGGIGRFLASPTSGGKDVLYAVVDVPGLAELRQRLADALIEAGAPPRTDHGFTPHITLAYLEPGEDNPIDSLPALALSFHSLTIAVGDNRLDIPFGAQYSLPSGRPEGPSFPWPVELKDGEPETPEQAFVRQLLAVRARQEAAFRPVVEESLRSQAIRVGRRLDGLKADGLPDPDELLPRSEDELMGRVWQPHYVELLQATWPILSARLSNEVDFDLADPGVQQALRTAGERITGINAVTREAVRKELALGQAEGESIGQLSARVRAVVEETYSGRATTIARTELSVAQQEAAVERYKAAGITEVKVYDGTNDDICRPVAGTTQTLEWAAAHLIGHPNCTRCSAPVVEAD